MHIHGLKVTQYPLVFKGEFPPPIQNCQEASQTTRNGLFHNPLHLAGTHIPDEPIVILDGSMVIPEALISKPDGFQQSY
jgi:hypothetical protein